jgi:metal transporter CNNM
MHALIIVLLLALSALFSGLNLALMGLSPHELKRKMNLGDKRAARLYPIRKNGNLLLVTLLLGNVGVNAILSIFLNSLTTGIVAVIVATLLITIFGEIGPQAIFSRYAIAVGAAASPLVDFFLFILYPVAKPLAWALDRLLGHELPELFSRAELIKIIEEHADSPNSDIAADEERIARGALTFGDKVVREVMTPRSQVKTVLADSRIDDGFIESLKKHGLSRFPVRKDVESSDEIVGMLYLHDLADPDAEGKKVADVAEKKVRFVREDHKLDHVLNAFLKSKQHLFVVINEFSELVGVISIEDVLEEILDREIVGEFDKYEDLREVAKLQRKKL